MTNPTWPAEEYPEPPDDAFPRQEPPVAVPATVVASTIQTLNQHDDYFRHHAGTATRAELRAFAAAQGWDPIQGTEVLIEGIGLDALSLGWARDATRPDQPNANTHTASSSIVDYSTHRDAVAAEEHHRFRPATTTLERHDR
jgi:hypothetical protein